MANMTDTDFASSSSPPVPRVKSPPLAFERTPNDALLSASDVANPVGASLGSPSNMGRASPLSPSSMHEQHLQILVDQQANAIQLLHEAFGAERQVWGLEKERLYQRIASLEHLLKSGDHWSPAKSPVMSPSSHGEIVSPTARAVAANPSLPTIVEHENIPPLSSRRENAPATIDLPTISGLPDEEPRRQSVVTFTNEEGLKVEEIPPPRDSALSPPPPLNRMHAGHTPIRAPRPPTPPPQNMSMDGIEDTPTRNNTHINTLLSQSNDEDEDVELKGPLNMPELPNNPDATNFTLDMLSKKLEKIQSNPEEGKPMVFAQPSPGLASPASERDSKANSPNSKPKDEEAPYAPISTHQGHSNLSSNALSPTTSNTVPGALSPQEAHEAQVQAQFEQGGIRLKKKTSVNFGAPFGSLGFAPRRPSQDKS